MYCVRLIPSSRQSPAIEGRELASGEITGREPWSAKLLLDPGADLSNLLAVCKGAGPDQQSGQILRTGCEVVEERRAAIWSESDAMRAPGALFAALLVLFVALLSFPRRPEKDPAP